MAVYIQAIHMEPSNASDHEHIGAVQWLESGKQQIGYSNTDQMVTFINQGGDVRVADQQGEVHVGVVNASPPYLRTHADGRWTDNLLSLPRY
ncbi:DUF3892 domain-containing protein [Marmoricola sp. URHB0036]|uniref:DUF3892 domain-containing protein n=1 Tax=Marmoricola sp. URHB0036 TaxID=1298863 RepID=UPI000481E7BE|nr:DUF3892 domain-containing protein [Marmoricola sp. URHB0036]